MKVADAKGAYVVRVLTASPAEKVGLRLEDVITALDGKPVEDPSTLRNRIFTLEPGRKVPVTIVRGGLEKTLEIEVARQPDDQVITFFGFSVKDEPLDASGTTVTVDQVVAGGAGAQAGHADPVRRPPPGLLEGGIRHVRPPVRRRTAPPRNLQGRKARAPDRRRPRAKPPLTHPHRVAFLHPRVPPNPQLHPKPDPNLSFPREKPLRALIGHLVRGTQSRHRMVGPSGVETGPGAGFEPANAGNERTFAVKHPLYRSGKACGSGSGASGSKSSLYHHLGERHAVREWLRKT
jgi:hypothetical protein